MDGMNRAVRRAAIATAMTAVLIAVAFSQSQTAFDPGKTYPVEALKEDLKTLWDVLEEGHGGLDRYTPADMLKKSFDAAGSSLAGPLTELDFYSRLLPLVAGIKDGHTRLMLSPAAGAYLDAQPVFLPFGAPLSEGQGLCLQGSELGRGYRGRRRASGHRRDADERRRLGAPRAPSERRRDPDQPPPAPRASGRFRPAPGPPVRARGDPAGSASGRSGARRSRRSRSRASRRPTSSGCWRRDTRRRPRAAPPTSSRSRGRRPS